MQDHPRMLKISVATFLAFAAGVVTVPSTAYSAESTPTEVLDRQWVATGANRTKHLAR